MTPTFIEIARFKEFTVVNDNLDNKLLVPALIRVQDLHLRGILGKDLYNELVTQINANTVTSLNQTLLNEYIEPYLLNKVIAECMLDVTYKMRNKAVMTTSSEFGNVADLTDLSKLKGQYEASAEGYKNLLEEFMCDNSADYPLYCPKTTSKLSGQSPFSLYTNRPSLNAKTKDNSTYRYPKKDCCD